MALLHRPGGRASADRRARFPRRVRAGPRRGLISTPAGRSIPDRRAIISATNSGLDGRGHVSNHRPGGRRGDRSARGRPGGRRFLERLQLRLRRQRHVLGHPGRGVAARRHRLDPRDPDRRRPEPCLQHHHQRLRRHQGVGLFEPCAALQRRADARLRAHLRRRRRLHHDAGRPARRGRDLAQRADQEGRPGRAGELGPLAGHLPQPDVLADHGQGRLRRPDGLQPDGRQLERDGQDLVAATSR